MRKDLSEVEEALENTGYRDQGVRMLVELLVRCHVHAQHKQV